MSVNILDDIKLRYKQGNAIIKLIMVNVAVHLSLALFYVPIFLILGHDKLTNFKTFIENWFYFPSDLSEIPFRFWTIFSYMIEGQGSKTFSEAKKMLYQNPVLAHELLKKITKTTILYLKAQIQAGADMVQLFDSWAGILSYDQYMEFGMKYVKEICNALTDVPKTVFSKGAYFVRKELGELNCQIIGLDWNMDIKESRMLIGEHKTLQGNLDPCVLYSDFKRIENETKKMLCTFGKNRHIANLGHGVYPDVKPDKVQCFVETVKSYRH